MKHKISIRFYNDCEVRAVWDEALSQWMFCALDVVAAIRGEEDYSRCRNYWKYLKNKLIKGNSQVVSRTNQLKFLAPDGKLRLTDALDAQGVILLAAEFPNNDGAKFIQWFTRSDETIDGRSKQKAYELFASGFIDQIEVGTAKGLRQIHAYIFSGLYDFAGQIRRHNISKGGFTFASALYLDQTLAAIENMPTNNAQEIIAKYVEMNVAHPFMEGNGRSTRIWLDMRLKKELKLCVDWSAIKKHDYLKAMEQSPSDATMITQLITNALTNKIDDREFFMKGIDYSYYYEEV